MSFFEKFGDGIAAIANANPILAAVVSLVIVIVPLIHFVPSIAKGIRFGLAQRKRFYLSAFEKEILLLMQHGATAEKKTSDQIDGFRLELAGAVLGKDSKERKRVRNAIEGLLLKNLIEPHLRQPAMSEYYALTPKGKLRIAKILEKSLK